MRGGKPHFQPAPKADVRLARRFWRMAATRGGCVMCKAFPLSPQEKAGREADVNRIEGHHILAKRHLRRKGYETRFWDTRNGLGLCNLHHGRHESYQQRIPFSMVPAGAIEFADELEMLPLLEREYRAPR